MKRSFTISNLKTQSVNAMYTTTRHITQDYREWIMQVKYKLDTEDCRLAIEELKNYFDPKKHKIHVEILAKYKKFYTKEDVISAVTHDCSNYEKPIIDVLFDAKHFNIANDKNITRLVSEKEASLDDTDSFCISIEILDR